MSLGCRRAEWSGRSRSRGLQTRVAVLLYLLCSPPFPAQDVPPPQLSTGQPSSALPPLTGTNAAMRGDDDLLPGSLPPDDTNAPMSPNMPLSETNEQPLQTGQWEDPMFSDSTTTNAATEPAADNALATNGLQAEGEPGGAESLRANAAAAPLVAPMAEPTLVNSFAPTAPQSPESTSKEATGKLWRIFPRLLTGFIYDDNIFISHANPQGSAIYTLGGGFTLNVGSTHEGTGNFLEASYDGQGAFYGSAPSQNAWDQKAALIGQYSWTRLRVQIDSRYEYINGPNRDSGNFTRSTLTWNALKFYYDYSAKTTFKTELRQKGNLFPGLQSSEYYEAMAGAYYQIFHKLNVGLEGTDGYNTIQNSPNQNYQILKGHFLYTLDRKLDLKGDLGFQWNEYTSGGQNTFSTPVCKVLAEYTPYGQKNSAAWSTDDYTMMTLAIYRELFNSAAVSGYNYVATGLGYDATRFYHQWSPGISFGYENDTYISNLQGVFGGRVDNFAYVRPHLGYKIMKNLTANLYYMYRANHSNENQYAWKDAQYGINLALKF